MYAAIDKKNGTAPVVGIDSIVVAAPSIEANTGLIARSLTQSNRLEAYSSLTRNLKKGIADWDFPESIERVNKELDMVGKLESALNSRLYCAEGVTDICLRNIRDRLVATKLVEMADMEKLDADMFVKPESISASVGVKYVWLTGCAESNSTLAANAIYKFVRNLSRDGAAVEKFRREPPKLIFSGGDNTLGNSKLEIRDALAMVTQKLLDDSLARTILYSLNEASEDRRMLTFVRNSVTATLDLGLKIVSASLNGEKPRSVVLIAIEESFYHPELKKDAVKGSAAALLWLTENPRLLRMRNSNVKLGNDSDENHPMIIVDLASTLRAIAKESSGMGQSKTLIVRYENGSKSAMEFEAADGLASIIGENLSVSAPVHELDQIRQYAMLRKILSHGIEKFGKLAALDEKVLGYKNTGEGFYIVKIDKDGSIQTAMHRNENLRASTIELKR